MMDIARLNWRGYVAASLVIAPSLLLGGCGNDAEATDYLQTMEQVKQCVRDRGYQTTDVFLSDDGENLFFTVLTDGTLGSSEQALTAKEECAIEAGLPDVQREYLLSHDPEMLVGE